MDFLSQQNTDELYKFIRNDIFQKSSFDINNDMNSRETLSKFMKGLYEKNTNKNTTYLNNLVIEKIVPYFIKKNTSSNSIRGTELNMKTQYMDRFGEQNKTVPKKEISNFNPMANYNPVISSRPSVTSNDNKPTFNVQDYNKQNINSLLGSLEVIERPKMTNNKQNNKNTEEIYQKMAEERNYNSLVRDAHNFEGEIKRAEEAQKMIFEKIQNNKNRKNEISQMKSTRPELNFDPKQFYSEMNKVEDRTSQPVRFNLEAKDFSKDNQILTKDKETEELLKPDWRGKDIKESSKQSLQELYQPEGYIRERSNREFVIIDQRLQTDGDSAEFKTELIDPLVIDKMCDVYLEFISLLNLDRGANSLEQYICFVLSIDELPMNTSSNISLLNNKYIIPNESYGTSKDEIGEDTGADTVNSITVKLKSNYMSTITPQTLNVFNIKVYGYTTTGTLDLLQSAGEGRVIMGLIFKKQ